MTYNALARCGIDTLDELSHTTYEELERIRNLGRKGVSEIVYRLKEYGVYLECEDDPNKQKSRRKAIEYGLNNSKMRDVGFTTQTFNILVKAGIDSLDEISTLTDEQLNSIHGLGEKGISEIISKLEEHGLQLRRDNIDEQEKMQSLKQYRKADMKISDLKLSTITCNALTRYGIDTLDDLSHMTYEDLERINGLGKKGIAEIVLRLKEYGIDLECKDDSNKQKARIKAMKYGAIIKGRTSQEIAEASISSLNNIEMSDSEDVALKELVEKSKEGGMNLDEQS